MTENNATNCQEFDLVVIFVVAEGRRAERGQEVCPCVEGLKDEQNVCGAYINLIFLVALSQVAGDSAVTDISKHDHIVHAYATRKTERLEGENRKNGLAKTPPRKPIPKEPLFALQTVPSRRCSL